MAARSLTVDVDWWDGGRVPARVQRKLTRLVEELAPRLNEFEAVLWDCHALASNGSEWLLPKIELNLPLYEEGLTFRLRLLRLDETQIFLETRSGDAVAEVFLR